MMQLKAVLLSIRPKYSRKLFNGTKRVELRRVAPKLREGDTVFVYVSSPIKELQGKFQVEQVIEATPDQLWATVKHDAGLSKQEFDNYYKGAAVAYGIYLRTPVSIREPLSLNELRRLWSGFHPPQSFKYLSPAEIQLVSTAL